MPDHAALEPIRYGRIYARALEAASANKLTLGLIGLIFVLGPNVLAGWVRVASGIYNPDDLGQAMRGVYGEQLAVNLIGLVVLVAATRLVARHVDGKTSSLGEALSGAGRLFLPMLGMSIILNLAIGFGLVLLIAPGVYIATLWAVAVPVRVNEDSTVGEALSRSAKMTEGRRWPVLGFVVVTGLITMGPLIVIPALFLFTPLWLQELVVLPAVITFFAVFTPLFLASLYHELRLVKRGVGGSVAEVFA